MTVPVPVGVKVTLQVDAVAFSAARVQGEPVNDPAAVPVFVKATVPAGTVPPEAISWTVAVHVVAWFMTIAEGLQTTVVVVLCLAETTETGTLRVVLLVPPTLSTVVRVTVKVVVVVGLKV